MFNKSSIELEYVIIGMKFNVEFLDGSFSEEEQKDIRDFIEHMSEKMYIDRSYVECKENKRKSVFMIESGWNALRDLMLDSRFGKHLYGQSAEVLADAFATMSRCYVYECLSLKTEKFTEISVTVKDDCVFDVVVCKDTSKDYKTYKGRWQDWAFDENGKFLSVDVDASEDTSDEDNDDEDGSEEDTEVNIDND